MRSVVVLPAPFGPRKPVTEPGSTVKLSRSTARTLPRNTLVSSSTTMRPGRVAACGGCHAVIQHGSRELRARITCVGEQLDAARVVGGVGEVADRVRHAQLLGLAQPLDDLLGRADERAVRDTSSR